MTEEDELPDELELPEVDEEEVERLIEEMEEDDD